MIFVRLAFASCAFCVLRVLRFGCLHFGGFALWRVLPGFRLARRAFCVLDLLHVVRFGTLRLRSGICVLLILLRFPADQWWILVLKHLVTIVRKALTSPAAAQQAIAAAVPPSPQPSADPPTQVEVRIFPQVDMFRRHASKLQERTGVVPHVMQVWGSIAAESADSAAN